MRRDYWLMGVFFLAIALFLEVSSQGEKQSAVDTVRPAKGAHLLKAHGQLPLSFEVNAGQTDPRVKFLARGAGYTLFLTPTEAVVATCRAARANGRSPISGISPPAHALQRTLLLPSRPNLPPMPRMSTEAVEIGNSGQESSASLRRFRQAVIQQYRVPLGKTGPATERETIRE